MAKFRVRAYLSSYVDAEVDADNTNSRTRCTWRRPNRSN